jgi:hypothetical protein
MSLPTLIFNNIELLGYNHKNNFFGENSFNYSVTKTISLEGFVLDLQNTNGVEKIFNDVTQIKNLSKNFYNIIINDENYGVGKIIDLNFDGGDWVRTTKFNITIEILSEIPLQNLGTEFNSLNLNNKNLNLIKSINESFSIDFDTHNKILGGNHQIDIEYNANNINTDVITLAKRLASELLKTLPTNLSEGNYTIKNPNTYRFLNNETYDIINGKCGFNRKFSYSTANNLTQPFSITSNITIEINEQGVASAVEECQIKAENNTPSLYACALQGLNSYSPGSFSRCQATFNSYKSRFGIERNLNSHFLQKDIQINKFDGTISYVITFDNDKKNTNNNYIWENTTTLDRSDGGVWTVEEGGSIQGVGTSSSNLQKNAKYTKAENGWDVIKPNIKNRVINFWDQYARRKASSSLKEINQNVSRSPYQGRINYSYIYTDDPLIRTDLGDIKKLSIEYSDDGNAGQKLLSIFKEFIILNNSSQRYSLIQNRGLLQQGNFQLTLTADISLPGQDDIFNGYSYFNQLNNIADTNYLGGGNDKYIESVSYNSDEIEQTVTYNINYKYS